jgi:hypothetical protein
MKKELKIQNYSYLFIITTNLSKNFKSFLHLNYAQSYSLKKIYKYRYINDKKEKTYIKFFRCYKQKIISKDDISKKKEIIF